MLCSGHGPARDDHGVDGKQGEKEEELKGYLGAALVGVGVARSGLVAGAGGSAVRKLVGGRAPAR